jgi:ERCC4-type nuclease
MPKKKNEPNFPIIYIDDREWSGRLIPAIAETKRTRFEIRRLKSCDFILSDQIYGERKSVDDFFKSLIEDRKLFRQLYDLKSSCAKPCLILEGNNRPNTFDATGELDIREIVFSYRKGMNPVSVRGILNTIQFDLGIQVIWTNSIEETAQTLVQIAITEQITPESRYYSPHPKRTGMTKKEQLIYFMSSIPGPSPGIPGIGQGKAMDLFMHFDTVEAIVNAKEEELLKVHDVGRKTTSLLREFFTRNYKEDLTEEGVPFIEAQEEEK